MNPVLFQLGPLRIYSYGTMLGLGLATGIWLTWRGAARRGISPDFAADLSLYTLVAAIVGARAAYILLNLPAYLSGGFSIFAVNHGGLSFYGGLAGGLLVGIWYTRRRGISVWTMGDIIAPALALGEAITRIGCDIYGRPAALPWGVLYNGVTVHPVQLYSFFANYLIFVGLTYLGRKPHFSGELFLTYFVFHSVGRFVVEFFREGNTVVGPLKSGHLASLVVFLVAAGLLWWRGKRSPVRTSISGMSKMMAPIEILGMVLPVVFFTGLYYILR